MFRFAFRRQLRREPLKRTLMSNNNNNNNHSSSIKGSTSLPSSVSTNVPSAVTQRVHKLLAEKGEGAQGWDSLWQDGATPWNIGKPAPPLQQVFSSMEEGVQVRGFQKGQGAALVPGFGEGHDLLYLASQFATVTGLEISETAAQRCREQVLQSSADPARVQILVEDFFHWQPAHLFDFVFDYTFFCAIHPSLRERWAVRMSNLVRPGGTLMTLVFPLGAYEGGPPYAVQFQDYQRLLDTHFTLYHGPLESTATVPQRAGRELVALWQKK